MNILRRSPMPYSIDDSTRRMIRVNQGEKMVAEFFGPDALRLAYLFASADDLLKALETSLDQSVTNRHYCYDKNPDWRRSNERVNMTSASELMSRKAIAKANGSV